ncbi:MAG: DUF669 domain-containing protein [Pirellulales bacterium]|nr:DUF669 domain-containing protein [Pirellulales bacterium]
MDERKSFRDILNGQNQHDDIDAIWDSAEATPDYAPLPKGEYVARVEHGGIHVARSGTKGYKVTFVVVEGEHAGRKLWRDHWLTRGTKDRTKGELNKLGIITAAHLRRSPPKGIICRLRVVLHRTDDGAEFNEVKSCEVLRIETPAPDPFAPPAELPADTPVETPDSAQGDAQEGEA